MADVALAVTPRLRGWLHTVMAPVSLVAGLVLVLLAPAGAATVAACLFAASAVAVFTVSGVYHRGHWSAAGQALLKRWDHANIFVLIAGSYTPFAVLALRDEVRSSVLAVTWSGAIAGAVFRIVWVEAPRWLYVALYLALGWAAVLVVPQLVHGAGVAAFVLIAVGGAFYSAGAVVYALRRPDPSPRWFGFHEVFHSCTIAAFICQYIAASLVVYRAA